MTSEALLQPVEPGILLRPREDSSLRSRFALSAAKRYEGAALRIADFSGFLEERRRAHPFRVDRILFADMDGWSFHPRTGNLGHRTGRFFTVEGLHVVMDEGPFPEWQQPIINQPEIGILGILAKEFDGVLHFLMQAKMEPGNPNLLQLSPTVQATRSNYTKVHAGANVKYLEYFQRHPEGRVLVDVLQSEHGAWFYRKSNRNVIVEVTGDVPADPDFCWLTLGQIGELLRRDNVVNMDSRTVLACAPVGVAEPAALHSDAELLSWYVGERARHRYEVSARRIPLVDVAGWMRDDSSVHNVLGRYFQVMAVAVEAGSREVTNWTQPLFEPVRTGLVAFVVRYFAGVPHVLAHARVEGGFLDTIELGPTVQCTPAHFTHFPPSARPPFLDFVLRAEPRRVRYSATHAEEGGRFYYAVSRYLFVEADEDQAPRTPPPGYVWATPGQLNSLVRHSGYVNVQGRTLLAVLNTGAVEL